MVKLKKTYYIIFSIALVLLIGIIILVVCLTIPQNASENVTSEQTHFTSNPNSSHVNSDDITTMTSQSDIYTIKEYNGHIGVFLNDETQPYKEVNVPLSALPAEDQELLKKGITANSQGEVQIILEDYIS